MKVEEGMKKNTSGAKIDVWQEAKIFLVFFFGGGGGEAEFLTKYPSITGRRDLGFFLTIRIRIASYLPGRCHVPGKASSRTRSRSDCRTGPAGA
jgi:hypothetical protein